MLLSWLVAWKIAVLEPGTVETLLPFFTILGVHSARGSVNPLRKLSHQPTRVRVSFLERHERVRRELSLSDVSSPRLLTKIEIIKYIMSVKLQ